MADASTYPSASPAGGSPYLPERKLDVGLAATGTWTVFRKRAWTFLGIAVLSLLASLVVVGGSMGLGLGRNEDRTLAGIVVTVATIFQYAIQFACQNATIYAGDRVISGTPFGMGEALSVGFRRLLPFIGVAILVVLIIIVGFLLLVIPGLIASVALSLAAPACVIEQLGPVASIKRSFKLTKGNRWRIIGAILLGIVLPFIALLFAIVIFSAILAAVHLSIVGVLLALLMLPAFLILTAAGPIILSVLFVELRALKEGVGPRGAVAGVFD